MSYSRQKWGELIFKCSALAAIGVSLALLILLVWGVAGDGFSRLDWSFISSYPSRFASQAGILAALAGSLYLILLSALFAVPIGVGAALYLEEYAKENWFTRVIELNIANLAGIPSVIYGLLGLQVFVRYAGFGRSLLSGALTLGLLVLPIIIISAREAIRAVPSSLREASIAMGATKWQTLWHQVLPVALPGIMTGCILAVSRALGETAPLVTLGALTYVAFIPDGLFSPFTALPIQIFNWTSRPQEAFHQNAAAGILVLLVCLLSLNSIAIYLRARYQTRLK